MDLTVCCAVVHESKRCQNGIAQYTGRLAKNVKVSLVCEMETNLHFKNGAELQRNIEEREQIFFF